MAGVAHELHGAVIHIHVIQLHLRVFRGDADHRLPPQAGGFEHVRLIHARQLFAALHSHIKGHARNALDFRHGIALGVISRRRAVFLVPTTLAEIDAARQLAHNEDVELVADDAVFNRRSALQRLKNFSRPQVRIQPQRAADAEQSRLRALAAGQGIPLPAADRAEQHGIRLFAGLHRLLRQRLACCIDCAASHELLVIGKAEAEFLSRRVEHLDGLRHNFRADPIAAQDDYVILFQHKSPHQFEQGGYPP